MFENIGEKLKKYAQVIFWIEVVGTVIAAIILFVAAGNSYYSRSLYKTWGWILLIAGPVSSWISSALLYGFAELIEKVTEIANNTKQLKSGASPSENVSANSLVKDIEANLPEM